MSEVLVLPRRNEDPDFGNGSIFFVGTATVLIRYAGFTILTDPNFLHRGDHVHLGYGLISRRQTNPALEFEEDRKTRLNSSHANISYAVFCLKKKRLPRGAAPHRPAPTPFL